jgi:hypothetical protein
MQIHHVMSLASASLQRGDLCWRAVVNVFHIALLHTTESLSTGLSRFHIFQEVLSQPCLNYEDIIVQSRERH